MTADLPAFQLENVRVTTGGKTLVAIDSGLIPRATFTAVCGPNGAGKSTLLRALAGVLPPAWYHGNILVRDRSGIRQNFVAMAPTARAKLLAWIPAALPPAFAFSVLDLVILGRFAHHRGTPGKRDRDVARSALSLAGVASFAERSVLALSAGELARVAVARGLAAETEFLLFDEPAANLDIAASLSLMEVFKRLARDGKTIVASMHDLALAQRHASHAIVLAHGRIARAGAPRETFDAATLANVFGLTANWIEDPSGPAGAAWPLFQSHTPPNFPSNSDE